MLLIKVFTLLLPFHFCRFQFFLKLCWQAPEFIFNQWAAKKAIASNLKIATRNRRQHPIALLISPQDHVVKHGWAIPSIHCAHCLFFDGAPSVQIHRERKQESLSSLLLQSMKASRDLFHISIAHVIRQSRLQHAAYLDVSSRCIAHWTSCV